MPKPKVYFRPGWFTCGRTKEFLSSQGIAYVNGDVEHDQASMDELLARGMKSVPVTIWDDHVVIGFNPKALARLFNLSGAVTVVDLPTMLAKLAKTSFTPVRK